MDKITEAKNEFRLRQWSQIIKACQESGMKIVAWCEKNNVNVKTYYYWLRKTRALACDSSTSLMPAKQQIVPVAIKQVNQPSPITIHLSSFSVDIYDGASKATIEVVLEALKSIC